jgi:hypothetical protein
VRYRYPSLFLSMRRGATAHTSLRAFGYPFAYTCHRDASPTVEWHPHRLACHPFHLLYRLCYRRWRVSRGLMSSSSPTRSCPTRGHPTHRQENCVQRMGSANSGYRKFCRIFVQASISSGLRHLHPIGNLDLSHFFPFFRSAQLEVLFVFAALLLFLTQAWARFHVKGRVFLGSSYDIPDLRFSPPVSAPIHLSSTPRIHGSFE